MYLVNKESFGEPYLQLFWKSKEKEENSE